MPALPQRHCGIQMAAALIFACTVMNLSLFVGLFEELWTERLRQNALLRQRTVVDPPGQNKVCVLIPAGDDDFVWNVTLPSMAASVRGETQFTFGIVIGRGNWTDDQQHALWFQQQFSTESTLEFVGVPTNESTVEKILHSEYSDGCSFYFVISNHTEFISPGWAHALMRALQSFSPPFVGAVSPAGCKGCIFVRETHREIFFRRRFRLGSCWAEWVRSVYGACRVSDVADAAVYSNGRSSCPLNRSVPFLDLVSRGRLFVTKFIYSLQRVQ